MMLEDWSYRAIMARDAGEALLQLADGPPDLLLCDYLLAGGAIGPRVVAELRRACGGAVPALFVTGVVDAAPLAENGRHRRHPGGKAIQVASASPRDRRASEGVIDGGSVSWC